MTRTITTINDARLIVADMVENYTEQPTPAQLERAARALVEHVGGYGHQYDSEGDTFDLDAAMGAE